MTFPLGQRSAPAAGEQPVLDVLNEAGYDLGSLEDLRNSRTKYVAAIPILVASLSAVTEPRALEEVVRTLSVPWGKPEATKPLIDLFRRVDDPDGLGLRWAVGNALDVTWDDTFFDELVSLAREQAYGRAREMVVLGFARSKRPEATDVLIDLLNDPAVNGHATAALRKLMRKRSVSEAREGLTKMLGDKRTWVRKEAERALATLN